MSLEDDPELERIESEIEQCNVELRSWKKKKSEAEASAKGSLGLR